MVRHQEPTAQEEDPIITIFGGPLIGQDKWLGGALSQDGTVYGIPGSASNVLKIVPNTGEVSLLGQLRGPFMKSSIPANKFKWLRGILAGDGAIYGIPSNAEAVLKIDPSTGEVATMGGPLVGAWKYHGGVLAGDGAIYGIPCNAESVLKVVPSTGEVTTIGGPLVGKQKWYGGLLGNDGAVYGIPYNAEGVLKIVPSTGEVTIIGKLPSGGWKWHGGIVGCDGCIYGIPSHADSVLRIDPSNGEVATIGGPLHSGSYRPQGRYKYGGGVLCPDGSIYAMPSDADRVLKIVLSTGEVTHVGPVFECRNKWQNGFVGRDGAIYGIPCDAEAVLKLFQALMR